MKKPITKAQIRQDMEKQTADFLHRGGQVAEIERGLSGRENPDGPIKADTGTFQQPKTGRTYVPEVIAALDSRRNKKSEKVKIVKRRARKKIIYDDFGEPLREIWTEE